MNTNNHECFGTYRRDNYSGGKDDLSLVHRYPTPALARLSPVLTAPTQNMYCILIGLR
jgi:hypothetical protein